MAINLHEKYAKKIEQAYTSGSYVKGALSNKYDFVGVKTVHISTLTTVPFGDYNRTASANRYGTPTEMQDVVQELTLTQDKGFSLIIDKGNNADQNGIKAAGVALKAQIDEQGVPMMDKYIFGQLAAEGTAGTETSAITKSNVCDRISTGTASMDDAEVPSEGRTLFVNPTVYKNLKLSSEFVGVDSLGGKALAKGEVGTYDGMRVVKVPASRLGADVNFIIVHRGAACAPVKLNDTKIHKDPPGISGNLLEGRMYFDCFVFDAKKAGVYVDMTE